MKKNIIFITLFIFSASVVFLQPQLTFRFANPDFTDGPPALFQFDVEVKADLVGTFHRDLQVYINYNTLAFGDAIVVSSQIMIIPLVLLDDHYQIVNIADNTNSKFAVITEAFQELNEIGSSGYFTELPTEFTGLIRIELILTDTNQLAGINFDKALMNGGQYAQEINSTSSVAYVNPNLYENDWSNFSMSGQTLYLADGWSGISSYIEPVDNDVENLFAPIENDLVIIQNFSGIYYPAYNINTLGNCEISSGYIIKMDNASQINLYGFMIDGNTITLSEGWNLMPVLSECEVDVIDLFVVTDLVIVKEVA